MNILEQIRTTKGRFPCKSALCHKTGPQGPYLEFAFRSPEEAAKEEVAQKKDAVTLETLGFLYDKKGRLDTLRLADIASKTGPLFGANATEPVANWISESNIINDALSIQEAINGQLQLQSIDAAIEGGIVAKTQVRSKASNNPFTIYSLDIALEPGMNEAFYEGLPTLPSFKKFVGNGLFDYAFIDAGNDDAGSFLSVVLLAFKHEISSADFAAALAAMGIPVGSSRYTQLSQQAAQATTMKAEETPKDGLELAGRLEVKAQPLEESDRCHLQKLVHALASLRLQDVRIDVFRSAEADDFMVFPTYLSSLWYGFAKQLDQVKIGYCAECGRGFSIAGHRGIERSYCSEACKTKAKNARTKRQRDNARLLFMQGLSVEEVAKQVYAFELSDKARANQRKTLAEAIKLVQHNLAQQPALKRAVDSDLRARKGSPFTKRCIDEGVLTPLAVAKRIQDLGIVSK